MDNTLSNRTLVIPPTAAQLYDGNNLPKLNRYKWLSLELAEPNLGVPAAAGYTPPVYDINSYGIHVYIHSAIPSTDTTFYYLTSDVRGDRGWTKYSSNAIFSSQERPDLVTTDAALEELLYKYPQILTFTLNGSADVIYLEANSYYNPAVLAWTYNKASLASISATHILAKGSLNVAYSKSYFNIKSIPLSANGTGFVSAPAVTTQTSNPADTVSAPTLVAEMNSAQTTMTAIRVDGSGIFATSAINIVVTPPGSVSPPLMIQYLELYRYVAPPLSSLSITDFSTSSIVNTTSTFSITAVDWAGARAVNTLNVKSAGVVYYGISPRGYGALSGVDILRGWENTSRGGLSSVRGGTARTFTYDCTPDINSPDGYYYYVAYPDYMPDPTTIVQGLINVPLLSSFSMVNRYGVSINYRLLISKNRQTGLIPIVIT